MSSSEFDSSAQDEPVCYRLCGRFEDQPYEFILGAGRNTVGASTDNHLVLPVRGVSRHHAVLRLDGGEVSVEDLGSKNGVKVNGRRTRRQNLRPGDRLGVGPVDLVLERFDPEDARLALTLTADPPQPEPTCDHRESETTASATGHGHSWLALVNRLATAFLGHDEPDVGGCLQELVGVLGAGGAAVFHWQSGDRLELDRVAGTPPPTELLTLGPTLAAVRDIARREPVLTSCLVAADPPLALAAAADRTGEVRGLVVWGVFPQRGASLPVLETTLRLLLHALPEHLALASVITAPAAAGLAFPAAMVVGTSKAMTRVFDQLRQLLPGEIPVLITGETGVGKDLIARTLHASSARAGGPFCVVNCAAIPAELLEAELFGVEKGVATGVTARRGFFRLADGGVIFLDEIGDMSLTLQGKLLRALQSKEVHPVGAPRPIAVDVRVVAATNRDLHQMIEDGGFRSDLYYRIAGYTLEVPPLRHRRDDIPALVDRFLRKTCTEVGKEVRGISVKAMRALTEASWRGNVRELEHEVRRLVYLCASGRAIESSLLSARVLLPSSDADDEAAGAHDSLDLEAHVGRLERRLITAALARARGNRSRTARLLGLSRNGLLAKMRRHGLEG